MRREKHHGRCKVLHHDKKRYDTLFGYEKDKKERKRSEKRLLYCERSVLVESGDVELWLL